MIYQSFFLDENRQIREDKIKSQKGSIDSERGRKLINFLKKQYRVFVSNSVYAGVHTIIIVGAEVTRAGNIKTDFGKMAEELKLCFVSGASFAEAI
ncbi:hypothetical protein AMJ47_00560 [Parcubacteria bacterium DG_72]|nr:MAG: hypothetical protein AMJ47_00560 [Parcubacteria bacterium DG_72]